MLTGTFTLISVLVLIGIVVAKILFLGKLAFQEKGFLWASLEQVFQIIAWGFLIAITVTNGYAASQDTVLLANAFESSIYLYFGTTMFTIGSFLYILESIVILTRDLSAASKSFMPSRRKRMSSI